MNEVGYLFTPGIMPTQNLYR